MVWHSLQENEAIFSKNFRAKIRKITYLHKNAYSSHIINSRIVIRISDERAWHPLQENEAIFSKKYFSRFLNQIFEKLVTCIKIPAPFSLLTVE